MVEPVTALALGAGWFANKVLGPSADGLGHELKTFATDRIGKIFTRAKPKLEHENIEPLPPGFAVQFLQKASFSDDSDELTEAWANLLASAARGFQSRHFAYVEILSQLSAFDANVLAGLVPPDTPYAPGISKPVNLKIELRYRLAKEIVAISETQEQAQAEFNRLMALDLHWPGRITAARVHYRDTENETLPISGGTSDQFAAYDNLYRLGLIEHIDVDISMSPYETGLEGVLVTMLGIGFIQTCRGSA